VHVAKRKMADPGTVPSVQGRRRSTTPVHGLLIEAFACALLLLAAFASAPSAFAAGYLVYVGTYTGQGSYGIYAFRFDPTDGKVDPLGLAAATSNPSFLAAAPDGRFLYSVNEQNSLNGKRGGGVSAFVIDRETAALKMLDQRSSLGKAPAHLSLDKRGKCVLVANYTSGSVAVFPIEVDGSIGPHTAFRQHRGSSVNPARQAGPHAHFIGTDNLNRFALSADLGTDEVLVDRFDPRKCGLSPHRPPLARVRPGSGPRHIAFAPSGKFAYLASEMGSTVTVFAYDQSAGVLESRQTVSTVPAGFTGDNRAGEIAVDPTGRFLYVSNRGDQTNDLVVFRIDPEKGTLSFVQRIASGGSIPRHFAIDPTGRWLFAANHRSNNMQLFRVDAETGRLSAASQITGIYDPVCVVFVPAP
jgi:6-phosphogluconolactonase